MIEQLQKLQEMVENESIGVNSPNVFLILTDSSGSMCDYLSEMREGLEDFKRKMCDMDEKGSVIISRLDFSSKLVMTQYDSVEKFNTDYYTGGGTRLHEAIINGARSLLNGYDAAVEMLEDSGYDPKVALVVFSDGEDSENRENERNNAKEAVSMLNEAGIVTAFVCFGKMSENVASKLGFKNIDTKYDVKDAFCSISSSCIRQSQSTVSLTDSFFDNN